MPSLNVSGHSIHAGKVPMLLYTHWEGVYVALDTLGRCLPCVAFVHVVMVPVLL